MVDKNTVRTMLLGMEEVARNILSEAPPPPGKFSAQAGKTTPAFLRQLNASLRQVKELVPGADFVLYPENLEPILAQYPKTSEVLQQIRVAIKLLGDAIPDAEKPVDVRDIAVVDLFRAMSRLKLSSVVFLIGVAVTAVGSTGTLASRFLPKLAGGAATQLTQPLTTDGTGSSLLQGLEEGFVLRFADRSVLQALVREVLEEQPDGLSSSEEAMASLLWQVKSQGGFAEFLTGDRSVSLQVRYPEDGVEFDWDHGPNVVLKILANLGYEPEPDRLRQLNAELNLLGVAWVDEGNTIVRAPDGGLALVGDAE